MSMFLYLQHENPPSLFAMLKSAGRYFYGNLWNSYLLNTQS